MKHMLANVNIIVFVVVIGLVFDAEAGWLDSVASGLNSAVKTVSQAAKTDTQLQGAVSGQGSESAFPLTNAPSADSGLQLEVGKSGQSQSGDFIDAVAKPCSSGEARTHPLCECGVSPHHNEGFATSSIVKDEKKCIEAKTAQNSGPTRGSVTRKVKEDDGGWRSELEKYGYSDEEIASLLKNIKEMSSEGFSKEAIKGILEIKDQKVSAETKKKDAEELAKLNIDDLKSLSKTDRDVLAHIDQELTPLLVRKGASASEVQEMKKQILVQLRKVDEANRLAAARHAIHELIRMHGLDK